MFLWKKAFTPGFTFGFIYVLSVQFFSLDCKNGLKYFFLISAVIKSTCITPTDGHYGPNEEIFIEGKTWGEAFDNGFIEGCQSEPVLRILKNFSDRAGLTFCGGIGIGGGVMLNVTRIIFLVQIGLFLLNLVLNFIQNGLVFPLYLVLDFLKSAGIILFFNAGVLLFISQMGFKINKSGYFGKKYTRILIPSFIFIIFADIFFIVISVFKGGIFRGLFSKKQPDDITISKEN